MTIPQPFIQDLIARTDIVEIIQPRVVLKKRGHNYQACCPFHNEKTPSFTVSQQKQFYYCFGCGAHGNAIGFLMAYDRMEFIEAINYLASQLGIEVPQEGGHSEQSSHYQALYPLLEQTANYYQQALRQAQHCIDYLKKRGLTGTTAKRFGIGFAPAQAENFLRQYANQPESIADLVTAGVLVKRDNGTHYDRFRQRVIFPIRDVRGRVIGFGGRSLGDEQPKYLNSPETPVFHKSQELYGLYEARQANRHLEQIIIVEGYMDVVSLSQHGITNVVATLGTATNIKHLQKLLRYTTEIIFCFDGDRAGRQAGWKALTVALPILRDGINIRFLFLPEAEDPDSIIRREGAETFLQRLKNAEPLSDVLFSHLEQEVPLTSLDNKARFANTATQLINTMPHGVFQQLLQQRLAQILQLNVKDLSQLEQRPVPPIIPIPHPNIPVSINPNQQLPPIQLAIALLLQAPQLSQLITEAMPLYTLEIPGKDLLIRIWKILQKEPTLATGQLLTRIDSPEEQKIIAQLAAKPLAIPVEGYNQEFIDTLNHLKQHHLEQTAHKLIEKAKKEGLNSAEKLQLQKILAQKAEKLA